MRDRHAPASGLPEHVGVTAVDLEALFAQQQMELQMQMLLWRLPTPQAFQLPQKIFNQCNRQR